MFKTHDNEEQSIESLRSLSIINDENFDTFNEVSAYPGHYSEVPKSITGLKSFACVIYSSHIAL